MKTKRPTQQRNVCEDFDFPYLGAIGKPMTVPFVFPVASLGLVIGNCRGDGGLYEDLTETQTTLGIWSEDGDCFAVVIDTERLCKCPTFVIAGVHYHNAILDCRMKGCKVDPKTGRMIGKPTATKQRMADLPQPVLDAMTKREQAKVERARRKLGTFGERL